MALLRGAVVLGVIAVVVVGGACASVTGLDGYSSCGEGCADASRDSPASFVDSRFMVAPEASSGGFSTSDSAPVVVPQADAQPMEAGDGVAPSADASPPTDAPPSPWTCARGGCNAAGGGCSSAGACQCTDDSQCLGGKCVRTAGRNDVSCGAKCTGSGPADGFGCQLGSPGVPASCSMGFGYAPSNFDPKAFATHVPSSPTAIGCDLTYDSSAHAFMSCTGSCPPSFCSGATPPYVAADVAQTVSGGPKVDVLVFAGLAINSGATLTLTSSNGGGNAVIFAVYGDATIAGTIRADAKPGVSGGAVNTNTPGASGPGGNFGCPSASAAGSGLNGGPTCTDAMNDCRDSGGAGGTGSAAGGAGGMGIAGVSGPPGPARSNASLAPLVGGCSGGSSGGWACTTYGGGGGGAVQISAAGAITLGGSISASGGSGGTSTCSASFSLCGMTYPGGGGGGGGGGAVLLEGETVTMTGLTSVNGGAGGNAQSGGMGGAGGTSSSMTGKSGAGNGGTGCGSPSQAGGGGGGGYGSVLVNSMRPGPAYTCATTLAPSPACNAAHTACLCAADSNCPSGRCVDTGGNCAGSCTGSGTPDPIGCETLVAGGQDP
ncbi:MAG TPA: hypothetical protein VKU41_27710 [Polyangiaceae bacterium]|nr:hypothetical protein [Polyangiaceae bacterium]